MHHNLIKPAVQPGVAMMEPSCPESEQPARRIRVVIYYDGDCPFCSDYVRYLRLRESLGEPTLVNLRDAPQEREALQAEGFDLDRGMVADISGRRYEGPEALHALALLTTRSGVFNRAMVSLFSSPRIAQWAYPVLRAGRNTMLTLLGREPFRADDQGWQALFTIFSLVFGLFAIIHFFIYAFRYTAFDIHTSTWLILVLGVGLFVQPGSKRLFVLLIAAMAVDAWLHAPVHSNHTILRNFLLLAFLGAAVWHVLKGSRWSEFFQDVVPVGRVLLLVMYVFGVFHKVNAGFLDPSVSCAVTLWRVMPWPIHLLDHPIIHYLAIYGTFVVELAIMVMLIVARFRNWGIILGIGFHCLLALSGFAMYSAFSTLTIALHVLFLSPQQARLIVAGERFQILLAQLSSWKGVVLLAACMPLIAYFAILQNYNFVTFAWLLLAIPLFLAILWPGKSSEANLDQSASPPGPLLWSRLVWLNLVGVLFFVNCMMPYFGLKTAQAMNMFANLRLEGGVNNHLIMSWAPAPFGYLHDLVELRTASGDRYLEHLAGSDFGLVYYDLLNRIDRSPGASVTFVRGGNVYEDQTAESLRGEITAILHPEWFRKWFHFQRVHTSYPPPCY